jgi:NitT/TauT family transport system ATP-binding protein
MNMRQSDENMISESIPARATKISISGVTKAFSGKTVLERVDLSLYENSFTCLLGPSGCGKSTLLNMMAGFLEPTTGDILIDGNVVRCPGRDRGMVFQEYALFPWRTVLENVAVGPMFQGKNKNDQRDIALRYLGKVGLAKSANMYPRNLSGGMKQRVAIARALANDPSILLMDEPFGALDAQTRETLQDEMKRIWEHERKTVVVVTHSISEAIFLADRIVVMGTRPGRVKEVIDVNFKNPRDRFSPEFGDLAHRLIQLIREESSNQMG